MEEKSKPLFRRVDKLCEKYALSDTIKQEINDLCKASYIAGVHDTLKTLNPQTNTLISHDK